MFNFWSSFPIYIFNKPEQMSAKRRYNEASLGERLNAINHLERKISDRKVVEKYGVSVGTVSNWWKRRDDIRSRGTNNEAIDAKLPARINGQSAVLDEQIYNWFSAARANNIPVSGPILQQKALHVAELLHFSDFKASNGWLEAFRKRHNISFRLLSREGVEVDHQVFHD